MTINPVAADLPDLPDIALSCDGILNRQYHLYQPKKGYRFGTDAIMLNLHLLRHFMAHASLILVPALALLASLCRTFCKGRISPPLKKNLIWRHVLTIISH